MSSIIDLSITIIYNAVILGLFAFFLTNILEYLKSNEPVLISIDGNIGSGKSTLIEHLKMKFKSNKNISFLEEPVSLWISTIDNENKNILEKNCLFLGIFCCKTESPIPPNKARNGYRK